MRKSNIKHLVQSKYIFTRISTLRHLRRIGLEFKYLTYMRNLIFLTFWLFISYLSTPFKCFLNNIVYCQRSEKPLEQTILALITLRHLSTRYLLWFSCNVKLATVKEKVKIRIFTLFLHVFRKLGRDMSIMIKNELINIYEYMQKRNKSWTNTNDNLLNSWIFRKFPNESSNLLIGLDNRI